MTDHPDTIPARTPTLAELHRRWMHARMKAEQAERAKALAYAAFREAEKEERAAGNALAERLLGVDHPGAASRTRTRTVALAGEVVVVAELGVDHPGEFDVTPIAAEFVALD